MIRHTIRGQSGESQILVGEELRNLERYLDGRSVGIVTDETVLRLYGDLFPSRNILAIGQGEGIKTLTTLESLYRKFLEWRLDRASLVIAVGGGIVCDIAGFAAATYLRGISCGLVPTTLLAQVDASVGGKTGVNFQSYKNQIGVFAQPEFVLIDPNTLTTLDADVLGCGLAEVVKHGAIADAALFAFLEERADDIRAMQTGCLQRVVNDSVLIKSSVVNQDEKEHGERRKLNFGHTVGHAVEKVMGLPHGQAVAVGMTAAAYLSQQRGYLRAAEVERLTALLKRFNLPTGIEAGRRRAIQEALAKDKKRYGVSIKFVLLREIGAAIVEDVPLTVVEHIVEKLEQ